MNYAVFDNVLGPSLFHYKRQTTKTDLESTVWNFQIWRCKVIQKNFPSCLHQHMSCSRMSTSVLDFLKHNLVIFLANLKIAERDPLQRHLKRNGRWQSGRIIASSALDMPVVDKLIKHHTPCVLCRFNFSHQVQRNQLRQTVHLQPRQYAVDRQNWLRSYLRSSFFSSVMRVLLYTHIYTHYST